MKRLFQVIVIDMKKVVLFVVLAAASLFGCVSMWGASVQDTISVAVYFRQGDADFDASFRGNGQRLESFASHVRELSSDKSVSILSVRIVGGASPEGRTDYQKVLSERRAYCLERRLRSYRALPSEFVEIESLGIDWDGLTQLVEESRMPFRTRTLEILLYTPEWIRRNGVIVDGRKQQLRLLSGGRAWTYMDDHFFPDLRRATAEIIYYRSDVRGNHVPEERVSVYSNPTGPANGVSCSCNTGSCCGLSANACSCLPSSCGHAFTRTPRRSNFLMALKTNALYDFDLVPNLGLEFHLGKGWSFGTSAMYAWWSDDPKALYYRIYGADISLRKYFGSRAASRPLSGHHLGVYGQAYTYDFEFGSTGHMGGLPGGTIWDRANWGAGVEYGYSIPISRCLNVDFSIGAGYTSGTYEEYAPIDNHYVWQATRKRQWFGPAKAEISFVWLIGPGRPKSK